MTEQELIDIINGIIDADTDIGPEFTPEDIARRALERSGGGFEPDAVADIVAQVLSARCDPWEWPPGKTPRLKEWTGNESRLAPKPSVVEIIAAGRRAGEPAALTAAKVRRAYPGLSDEALVAEWKSYIAWLKKCAEDQVREARMLERLEEIIRPATDENPILTVNEALRVMASRGSEEAQRALEGLGL